jgi:SAM-dependent methyltransferase
LKLKTNLFHDSLRVLHFAPERWFKALSSLPNLEYLSADLEPGRAMVAMDITQMPLRDESVDVILCSHVLEHVPDDRRAMREMHRVLRPGGWALVLVPIVVNQQTTFEDPDVVSPEERTRLFGQADHVRRYGRDIKNRLEDAGFAVTPENYTQELSEETRYRHGLKRVDREYIYLCRPSSAPSTLCMAQGLQQEAF